MTFVSVENGWRVSYARRIVGVDYVWDNLSKYFVVLLFLAGGQDEECVEYRAFTDSKRLNACVDAIKSLDDPWLVNGLVQDGAN